MQLNHRSLQQRSQKAVQVEEKLAREAATQAVKDQVTAVYEEKYADHEEFDRIMRDVAEILEQMEHAEVRRLITEDKVRPDGRKVDENPSFGCGC